MQKSRMAIEEKRVNHGRMNRVDGGRKKGEKMREYPLAFVL